MGAALKGPEHGTAHNRVNGRACAANASNERYWVSGQKCTRCPKTLGFYRWTNQPRPEPTVCPECAARAWAAQGNRPHA